MDVQASRLKAVAIVLPRLINSRATRGEFLWRPFPSFPEGGCSKIFRFTSLALLCLAVCSLAHAAAAQTNGISSSATNTVGLWANSTEYLHVSSTGNVGIGTASPTPGLEVWGFSSGLPASSGTTVSTGGLRLANSSQIAFDFGVYNTSPFGAWIQAHDWTNQANNYPLLLEPNGGNVGIGTTAPQAGFHVYSGSGNPSLSNDSGATAIFGSGSSVQLDVGGINSPPYGFWLQTRSIPNSGSTFPLLLNPSGGNVGIGTTAPGFLLDVDGSARVQGTFHYDWSSIPQSSSTACYDEADGGGSGRLTTCSSSDIRLKKDIHGLEGSLDKIKKLRGVSFYWRTPDEREIGKERPVASPARQVGVIAQDVEKVFPELVTTDSDGVKSVSYQILTAPLIEAVKELNKKNDGLAGRLAALKADNDNLRAADDNEVAQIKALTARLDALEAACR